MSKVHEDLRDLIAERDRLIERNKVLREALDGLFNWCAAQPFREQDGHPIQQARAALAQEE